MYKKKKTILVYTYNGYTAALYSERLYILLCGDGESRVVNVVRKLLKHHEDSAIMYARRL